MSTLYNEPHLGLSAIIATNRQNRPHQVKEKGKCPFCPENHQLLEQVWLEECFEEECIRVVNNKYPVCGPDETLYGFHDVVIDTLVHYLKPHDFSSEHWERLLRLIQRRWCDLSKDDRIEWIQVFKNEGEKAGASIMHAHWQIVALSEIPLTMQRQYESVQKNYQKEKKCKFCTDLKENRAIIDEDDEVSVFIPYWATMPYEVWIMPKKHYKHLGEIPEKTLKHLADALKNIVGAYIKLFENVSYNICMMGGPIKGESPYHFYIKLLPRTGQFAGFELATGCFINVYEPLDKAKQIKEILNVMKGEKDEGR